MKLVSQLMAWGFSATRINLHVDCKYGRDRSFVDHIIDSCHKGELCRAKTRKPYPEYRGQTLVGYGVDIGKRGDAGSGRYIRAYDKGLQTGEKNRGHWGTT